MNLEFLLHENAVTRTAELSASDHILILFLNFIFFSSFYVCFNARSQPCSREASPVCWVFSIWHLPLLHWIRVAINLKYLVFSSAQWCFVHNSREFVVLCASRLFPILWDLTFWIKSLVGHGESFSFHAFFSIRNLYNKSCLLNHLWLTFALYRSWIPGQVHFSWWEWSCRWSWIQV